MSKSKFCLILLVLGFALACAETTLVSLVRDSLLVPMESSPQTLCRAITCDPFGQTPLNDTKASISLTFINATSRGISIPKPLANASLLQDIDGWLICATVPQGSLSFEVAANVLSKTLGQPCRYVLQFSPLYPMPVAPRAFTNGPNVIDVEDYVNVTKAELGSRFFNGLNRTVHRTMLQGVNLSLDAAFMARVAQDHWNDLVPLDQAEVWVVADNIKVSTNLTFPGTNLSFWARNLEIGPGLAINLTGADFTSEASLLTEGLQGTPSGNLELHASSLSIDSTAIIDLRGGKGQQGGRNEKPFDGSTTSLPTVTDPHCQKPNMVYLPVPFSFITRPTAISVLVPSTTSGLLGSRESGGNVKDTGRSGDGGNGGSLLVITPSQCAFPYPLLAGGPPGEGGISYPGGAPGLPRDAFWARLACFNGDCSNFRCEYMSDPEHCGGMGVQKCPHTDFGKNGSIPIGNPGAAGTSECKPFVNECSWMHELIPMVIDDLTRDLAKVGQVSEAMRYLQIYASALETCTNAPWASVYMLQFQGLFYNLTRNLDGYGLSRIWVPGLSTEVTAALYVAELDMNIRIQFGVWQVLMRQNNRQSQKASLTALLGQSYQELDNLASEIDTVLVELADLSANMDYVSGFLEDAAVMVSDEEKMLMEAAKSDAKKEAEVPRWQQICRLAATVAQYIPVPEIAGAGAAMNEILDVIAGDGSVLEIATKIPSVYKLINGNESMKTDISDSLKSIRSNLSSLDFKDFNKALSGIENIMEAGKTIASAVKGFRNIFEKRAVDENLVQEIYDKLVANDGYLKNLMAVIEEARGNHSAMMEQFSKLTSKSADLATRVVSTLHLISKTLKRVNGLEKTFLDPSLERYLDSTRRRSEARLDYWENLFARSWEYRLLIPYKYPASGGLARTVRRRLFQSLANFTTVENAVALATAAFHGGLQENLLDLANMVSKRIGATNSSFYVKMKSPSLVLSDLNSQKKASISLQPFEFPQSEENQRIFVMPDRTSLGVSVGLASEMPQGSCSTFSLTLSHSHFSKLRSHGRVLIYDHADNSDQWSYTVDADTGGVVLEEMPTYSEQSLLFFLSKLQLGHSISSELEPFALVQQPSVWSDYTIELEPRLPFGCTVPALVNLSIFVPYSKMQAPRTECEMVVHTQVPNSTAFIAPRIAISPVDKGSFGGGEGPYLYRIFDCRTKVSLDAEPFAGALEFLGWNLFFANGTKVGPLMKPHLDLSLTTGTEVTASYDTRLTPSRKRRG